jgi:peptidyl-prolyl cis-trans isomerase SurA
MKKLVLVYFFIILFLNFTKLNADKVEIVTKIGTDILTNIDIENEYSYLIALNNTYKTIEDDKIYNFAKESLIKEKIKKKELEKFFVLGKKDSYLNKKIQEIYKNLGFNNISEFENYLQNYNLRIADIYRKIEIEIRWNELIFNKYKNQITINKEILKEKLITESKNRKSFNLSELVFSIKNNSEFKKRYTKIKDSINNLGFEKSVLIHSIAASVEKSGNLGWIDEISLSKVILNELKQIKISEVTKPIKVPNGILILKLNDVKKVDKSNENIDSDLEELINFERNKQLTIFSSIYFNKIKNKAFIDEQ